MIINNEIKNEEYVDSNKLSNNIRLLTMNSKGLNLWNYEWMEMFIESIEKYQIDVMLLNETNVKWTLSNKDKMENVVKRLGRETTIYTADSSLWTSTKSNYLPRGVLSIVRGKARPLVQEVV